MTLVFAVMHLYNIIFFIASVHSFFKNTFLESGIDKSREWYTIPACPPSLMCFFFNRGDTKGSNSSKILCSMFIYVLFYVNLFQD